MARILLAILLLFCATSLARAQEITTSFSAIPLDPCQANKKTFTPINMSTATTLTIVAGVSSKKTFICSIFLFAAGADNVGVVEGTGTNCSTVSAGIFGGTTAASGINLAANQGWQQGDGGFTIAQTATNADNFCLVTSAAVQLSGGVTTVQQ